MKCRFAAVAALLIASTSLGAAGLDCRQVAVTAEKAICASPNLRAIDSELNRLYGIVRNAAGTLRPALVASQRAWVSARDHDCTDAACLAPRLRDRVALLGALSARVSDVNPTLPDLTAVWLSGTWRPETPEPPNLRGASDLPPADTSLLFHPGEMCVDGRCAPFGLEPQALTDGPGRDHLPAALGIASDTPFYLAYIDGKATYGLVPMPNGSLLAVSPGCAPAGSPCGTVRQVWRGDSADAALIRRPAAP